MVRESAIHMGSILTNTVNDPLDILTGDNLSSFEKLVRDNQSYAYSLAMRFLCDESEADDVVQESFIRVWKNYDRYDQNRKFTTWLYMIVTNLCLDRLRSMKRKRSLFSTLEVHGAEGDIEDARDWAQIQSNQDIARIISSLGEHLSAKQRLVFTLRDLQDLTMDEVAEITGMSMGAIKTNLHYARKTIREILARRYGFVGGDV